MLYCPICHNSRSDGRFCQTCGFDLTTDFVAYPTFCALPDDVLQARVRAKKEYATAPHDRIINMMEERARGNSTYSMKKEDIVDGKVRIRRPQDSDLDMKTDGEKTKTQKASADTASGGGAKIAAAPSTPPDQADASVPRTPTWQSRASVPKSPLKQAGASVPKSPLKQAGTSVPKSPLKQAGTSVPKSPLKQAGTSVPKTPNWQNAAAAPKAPPEQSTAYAPKTPIGKTAATNYQNPVSTPQQTGVYNTQQQPISNPQTLQPQPVNPADQKKNEGCGILLFKLILGIAAIGWLVIAISKNLPAGAGLVVLAIIVIIGISAGKKDKNGNDQKK